MKQIFYGIYDKYHKCLVSQTIRYVKGTRENFFVPVLFPDKEDATEYCFNNQQVVKVVIKDSESMRYYNVK